MFADEGSTDDAKHAIESGIGHTNDAAAIRQHHAFVHHFDRQRLAAQHFLAGLAVGDVVHHADESRHAAIERDDRLVREVHPAGRTAQRLQCHLRLGPFSPAQLLASLHGAGVIRRQENLAPAEAV